MGRTGFYEQLAQKLGANAFINEPEIYKSWSDAKKWSENLKFLNKAIARGDKFILSNSGFDLREGTAFEREVKYLFLKGYHLAKDGM